MSSILDLEADGSSDENDGDYVPPTGAVPGDSSSEEDLSLDEDLELEQKPWSRKGKRNTKKNEKSEIEVAPSVPPVDQKKRAENIWLDFLSDVSKNAPAAKKSINSECKEVTKTGEIKSEEPKPSSKEQVNETKPSSKEQINETKPSSKEQVNETEPEVFEFAGETFTISNEKVQSNECSPTSVVLSPPAEDNTNTATSVAAPKKRGGIESILGSISNKKKKLSTLEKTKYDWNLFKKSEGLLEDLEKYNKGKGGFVERQRFLERSDLRSFEIEKSMRQSKRKM